MPTLTQRANVATGHAEAKELPRDLKEKPDSEADFREMARSDKGAKIAYLLAGAILGAILIRIFTRLKQRVGRAAAEEQMGARLERVTS